MFTFNSEQCLGRNVKIPISRSHISLHIPHFLSWIISDSLAGISVPHQKFASTSVRIHFVNVFLLWVNGNLHFWPGSGFGLVKFPAIAMVLQTGSGMNKRVWWIYVVDTIKGYNYYNFSIFEPVQIVFSVLQSTMAMVTLCIAGLLSLLARSSHIWEKSSQRGHLSIKIANQYLW